MRVLWFKSPRYTMRMDTYCFIKPSFYSIHVYLPILSMYVHLAKVGIRLDVIVVKLFARFDLLTNYVNLSMICICFRSINNILSNVLLFNWITCSITFNIISNKPGWLTFYLIVFECFQRNYSSLQWGKLSLLSQCHETNFTHIFVTL